MSCVVCEGQMCQLRCSKKTAKAKASKILSSGPGKQGKKRVQKANLFVNVDENEAKEYAPSMNSKTEKRNLSYWSTEDSKYAVRVLEEDAYSVVISALRAQGPLSDYKRVLLEHLRSALFISLNRHKAEIRRAANCETLSKISKKLNPLTDTYFEWSEEGKGGGDVIKDLKLKKPDFLSPGEQAASSLADKLASVAVQHNAGLPSGEQSLFDLINLPKKIFVPEAIREFLNATESEIPQKPKSPLKTESQKLQKQQKSKLETEKRKKNAAGTLLTEIKAENREDRLQGANKDEISSISSSSTYSSTSRPETPLLAAPGAFLVPGASQQSHHISPQRKSPAKHKNSTGFGARRLAQQTSKLMTKANRSTLPNRRATPGTSAAKQPAQIKPDPSARCARVEPFIFAPAVPGQTQKPPRGNPDKRIKRAAGAMMRHPARAASVPGQFGATPPKKFNSGPPRFYGEGIINQEEINGNRPMQRKDIRRPGPAPEYYGTFYRGTVVPSGARYGTAAYAPYYGSAILAGTTGTSPPGPHAASPAAVQAAYSTPTRTYYGNPSAAAMGITVRPTSDGGRTVMAAAISPPVPQVANGEKVVCYTQRRSSTPGAPTVSKTSEMSQQATPGGAVVGQDATTRYAPIAPRVSFPPPVRDVAADANDQPTTVVAGPNGGDLKNNVVLVRNSSTEQQTMAPPVGNGQTSD